MSMNVTKDGMNNTIPSPSDNFEPKSNARDQTISEDW
jgi:hypothetical protein